MWGAVRGRHTGVQYGIVTGCSSCAWELRGSGQGCSMQLRKGRGVVLLRGATRWGAAAAQGAQLVTNRGAACGCTGAQRGTEQGGCVMPCRGVACGCKGAQPGAGLGRSGGVRGAAWDCAWVGRGAAQGAQCGAV